MQKADGIELLQIGIGFANVESQRNKLNQKIEAMIGKLSKDSYPLSAQGMLK